MSFASSEREKLGALLLELGPDAPTLLDGWRTRDLAAHLYVREQRLPWIAGAFVQTLAKGLDREMEAAKRRPYEEVVADWLAGPNPVVSALFGPANEGEHFIHHEDVRRAQENPEPRELSAATQAKLLKLAKRYGKLTLRKAPVPVILTPEHLPPVTLGERAGVADKGNRVVRVFGAPAELLLWVTGRTSAAQVRVDGADLLAGYNISLG